MMTVIRWMACFPGAMLASVFVWMGLVASDFFNRAYYGPALHLYILGLTPLILKTSIPAMGFVVAGVTLSPSKERKVAFSFFGLALLFSGGALEYLKHQDKTIFWISCFIGNMLGALIGLGIAL